MRPDGTVVAQYLVTVTNTGSGEATTNAITDTFETPSGFEVKDVSYRRAEGGEVTSGQGATFEIPGGVTLKSGGSISYLVTVTMKGPDFGKPEWDAVKTCSATGPSAFAHGFVNGVTSSKDDDGAGNNKACVVSVVPPTAHLTLVKQIVNPDGSVIANSPDKDKFTLAALGLTAGTTGISGTTGTEAVTHRSVIPGTYALRESVNDAIRGYKQNEWKCTGNSTALKDGQIQVKENENVTCTVTNQRVPDVEIVKTVQSPADLTNQHVGKPQEIAADGSVNLTYVLTVRNLSGFAAPVGPVSDFFLVPAGLVWNGDQKAKVTFDANGTGAQASNLVSEVTKEQLAALGGAQLASSVGPVPAKGEVRFAITIPLKADTTVSSGQNESNFQKNQQDLAKCTTANVDNVPVTKTDTGVPNGSSVAGEDVSVAVKVADNFACIPVVAPKPQMTVAKVDNNGKTLTGAGFTIYPVDPTKDSNAQPLEGYANGLPLVSGSDSVFEAKLPGTGTYYLVETKAPKPYELRPAPIQFNVTLAGDGTSGLYSFSLGAFDQNTGLTKITQKDGNVRLEVADVTTGRLPHTGSRELIGYGLLALVSAAGGVALAWRSFRQRE